MRSLASASVGIFTYIWYLLGCSLFIALNLSMAVKIVLPRHKWSSILIVMIPLLLLTASSLYMYFYNSPCRVGKLLYCFEKDPWLYYLKKIFLKWRHASFNFLQILHLWMISTTWIRPTGDTTLKKARRDAGTSLGGVEIPVNPTYV